MDEKIIKIANFDEYTKAEITKIALEREGIQCFLSGINSIVNCGLAFSAVGVIELCIKESDKQKAEEILKKINP
jgi:hypothetical protein